MPFGEFKLVTPAVEGLRLDLRLDRTASGVGSRHIGQFSNGCLQNTFTPQITDVIKFCGFYLKEMLCDTYLESTVKTCISYLCCATFCDYLSLTLVTKQT